MCFYYDIIISTYHIPKVTLYVYYIVLSIDAMSFISYYASKYMYKYVNGFPTVLFEMRPQIILFRYYYTIRGQYYIS